jgi:hypothetical protein
MNGAALADDTNVNFTVTNSVVAATDVVIVNVASVGTSWCLYRTNHSRYSRIFWDLGQERIWWFVEPSNCA